MDSLPVEQDTKTFKNGKTKTRYYTPDQWKQFIYERCLIHPVTGCWLWQKAILKPSKANPFGGGYGMMSFHEDDKTKMRLVHTVSYTLWVGPIPNGRDICHHDRLCVSKACCNPDHLYAGTKQQNIQDAIHKGPWSPGGYSKGKHLYTDGITREYHVPGTEPTGWRLGPTVRTYTYTKGNERAIFLPGREPAGWVRAYNGTGGTKHSKWYTNGTENILWFPNQPIPSADEGWRPSRTTIHPKKRKYLDDK
jgi:hypothetical protein